MVIKGQLTFEDIIQEKKDKKIRIPIVFYSGCNISTDTSCDTYSYTNNYYVYLTPKGEWRIIT